MKTDYSDLEGTEIIVIGLNGNRQSAIIGGCNYHVGVTLVDPDTKKSFWCVKGNTYMRQQGHKSIFTPHQYRKCFHHIVAQLKTGTFSMIEDARNDAKIIGYQLDVSGNPAESCPFI